MVGRDEGFDIAQIAIGRVWELRPYLRLRGLDAYYIRTCWSLAVGRYRRRWREVPMDEEGLEVANIQAHEREHGHLLVSENDGAGRGSRLSRCGLVEVATWEASCSACRTGFCSLCRGYGRHRVDCAR